MNNLLEQQTNIGKLYNSIALDGFKIGSACWARTSDPLINSRVND